MKVLVILGLTLNLMISNLVYADFLPGSKCGLSDDADADSWTLMPGNRYALSRANTQRINGLPTLLRHQLVIAAKSAANGEVEINNALDAVNYLRHNSDSSTLDVYDFRFNGNEFTQIKHYPGDNPYGFIFKRGTKNLFAYNEDGSVRCRYHQR